MNYELAAKKYIECRDEIERIELKAKAETVELKKLMSDLENWITLKAQEDGLETVPTTSGTAYWATHTSAAVAEASVFKDYVIANGAWDLLETRAAKLAVKSFIDANGAPPPGVNFKTVKVFNLRRPTKE